MDMRSRTFTADRAKNREHLLGGVEQIRRVLAAQCEDEETAATLSPESVEALTETGIFAMKLPAILGGAEADLVTQFEVLEALAAINASASWCTMVGATGVGMPGAFLPDEGAEKMFPAGRIPLGAICIMPAGEGKPTGGGYQVSGRWSFASGVRHSEWITAMARVARDADGPPELRMMVFPTSATEIHDNWQVAGLKGTGSCDFTIADLFVPEALSWNVVDGAPQRGGALYYLGIPAFVANEHAGFACGTARCALDALIKLAVSKKRGYGPDAKGLAGRSTVQRMIGESELKLAAARSLAIELNERAWGEVCEGNPVSVRLNSELRSVATYCTEVASRITTQAFRYSGAGAVYQDSVLQRCLRDINVAAQHLMVSEVSYENLGQIALGFPDVNPMG
ncbi:MAG: acyl-CoA dehydrogenase family protein [Pseudomonadota bacterium]|nr:acyl-CoA dehydrogenase family protein [Pseudomonadota bacterium]